jgi:hypothetical protein
MEWRGLEHALECFVLKFDQAVKIILRNQWVHVLDDRPQLNHVRKDFPRDSSKRPPRSRLIGLFDLTDYS